MEKRTILNQLLNTWPNHTVMTMQELRSRDYSYELVEYYLNNGWIKSLGHGAYTKLGDQVSWVGGLYALQSQLNLKIHVGGVSALNLLGRAHYIPMGRMPLHLFAEPKTKLPGWFRKYNWDVNLFFHTAGLFEKMDDDGLTMFEENNVSIKISSRERAIFEVLYHVPHKQDFNHARELFEGLVTIRPELVQKLLERCRSIKVKRLFLYFADQFQFPWFDKLDLNKVDTGKGKRVIVKNGKFNSKYLITVPVNSEELYESK